VQHRPVAWNIGSRTMPPGSHRHPAGLFAERNGPPRPVRLHFLKP